MRRISVAEVQAAYTKTGLTPRQLVYYVPQTICGARVPVWDGQTPMEGAACALSAVAIAASATRTWYAQYKAPDGINRYDLKDYLQLDQFYVDGFIFGFDAKVPSDPPHLGAWFTLENRQAYGAGYQDGVAAQVMLPNEKG